MMLNREIPCVDCEGRRLTRTQAVAAIAHAVAFIRLAKSLDAERFGLAADEWLEKYGPAPETTDAPPPLPLVLSTKHNAQISVGG